MMMRRILPCVLVLFVLAMADCGGSDASPAPPNEKNAATPAKPNSNTSANATPSIQSTSNSNTSTQPSDGSQRGSEQTQKGSNQDQNDLNQKTDKAPLDWLTRALEIAAGLLILALIVTGLLHLRNKSRQHLEHHLAKAAAAHASVTREAQKEILDKLSSLSSAQNDTSTRLHDVHTEIRTLARLIRESSVSRGDGRSYATIPSSYSFNDPPPRKEEPEFPVSAVDYLDKMTRFLNVVRPDFQNGILVNDPDGTGELVVIRDSRQDDGQPLFLVPRHAQFQTKQDFYTFYEKYYECARPSAGDVWIIGPAVVEKVSGGWQLREKGLLEIRS